METLRPPSTPTSARVSRVGFGVPPQQAFRVIETAAKVRDGEDALARHARRVRYPDGEIHNRIPNPVRISSV
jgi:hypothetical protein